MISLEDREIEYLLVLIRCAMLGESAPAPQGVDIEKLLKLADLQQVYSLVLPALSKTGALSEQELQSWNNYRLSDLQKTIIVENERKAVLSDLEEQGIKYILLKGLVLRDYYPQQSMRQMSDNDILYDSSRREDLLKIMKKHGFYLDGAVGISDDFKKSPCSLEFHREITEHKEGWGYLDLWQRAAQKDNGCEYLINKEDNYIYTLHHLEKHRSLGGCGIRFLCDMYVLIKQGGYDWNYMTPVLDSLHLLPLDEAVRGLCDAVFGDKQELNEQERELLEGMFNGGLFHDDYYVKPDLSTSGKKARYLLRRVFPEKEIMFGTYKELEKAPYLLPYYYIKRLVIKTKYNREGVKNELKNIK